MPIPIIDLFAGPGGLGEGFSSLQDHKHEPIFEIALSIEKDPIAHRTLMLRAVFRQLRGTKHIRHYYSYIRNEIDEPTFRKFPSVAEAFSHAEKEARCLELGEANEDSIDAEIRTALGGKDTWVLIGGPPCQAYSLAGRARRVNDKTFKDDVKHFLYREYLRIIKMHRPTIFVMENVKGILSSKVGGKLITSGPYRHIRHPMYSAVLLGGAALACAPMPSVLAAATIAEVRSIALLEE